MTTTSQTIDSTHIGKRLILRVAGDYTFGSVLLPDGTAFSNGDYIKFYVAELGIGSQIDFNTESDTPVISPSRLYRVGQYGTIYYTGSEWHVEVSPVLDAGPPIVKPAPLGIWNIANPINFGSASDHNLHIRSVATEPITVSVLSEVSWAGSGEYWMDNFNPIDIGTMPIGGAAIFGCHSETGGITFVADPDVTINTPTTLKLTKLHAKATLTKVGPNEWDLAGDLDPS